MNIKGLLKFAEAKNAEKFDQANADRVVVTLTREVGVVADKYVTQKGGASDKAEYLKHRYEVADAVFEAMMTLFEVARRCGVSDQAMIDLFDGIPDEALTKFEEES